jgi:hypothetical protein
MKIDHLTPEGLYLLGDVMNQFILWNKNDIVLIVCSPTSSDVHLERVVEDGEVYSPARDDHTPEIPHSSPNPHHHMTQPSPARTEQGHDETPPHNPQPSPPRTEQGHDETPHVPHKPQPSLARAEQGHDEMPQSSQQVQPTHEQRLPSQEGHAREAEDIPKKIRPVFVGMPDVVSVHKWYAHD